MKVKHLSIEATRLAYVNSCKLMGMDPDRVPGQYIDLSALVSRAILDAFCEENGLELPEETLDDKLKRLMDAGTINKQEAERIRHEMLEGGAGDRTTH